MVIFSSLMVLQLLFFSLSSFYNQFVAHNWLYSKIVFAFNLTKLTKNLAMSEVIVEGKAFENIFTLLFLNFLWFLKKQWRFYLHILQHCSQNVCENTLLFCFFNLLLAFMQKYCLFYRMFDLLNTHYDHLCLH